MTDLLSEDELAGLKALGDVAATKDQLLSAIEAGAYQADITRFERAIWQLFDRARAVRLLLAENNNLRAHIDALKAEAATARTSALKEAAVAAKFGWVSANYDVVGLPDADQAIRLCEHIERAILAFAEVK